MGELICAPPDFLAAMGTYYWVEGEEGGAYL